MEVKDIRRRRLMGPEMEGPVARWYARQRGTASQIEAYRKQALQLTDGLRNGADVLEIAPGPGYLSMEIARLGRFHVAGLDISRTFVQMASDNARAAGVAVEFHQGDAANLPFAAESFDLIVCQAAFKNFREPISALNEMHRVLRGEGTAVIQDMSSEASNAAIDEEVRDMETGRLNSFITKWTLATMLRRRAYSPARFERLVADSAFRTCEITTEGIGLEVRLTKREAA